MIIIYFCFKFMSLWPKVILTCRPGFSHQARCLWPRFIPCNCGALSAAISTSVKGLNVPPVCAAERPPLLLTRLFKQGNSFHQIKVSVVWSCCRGETLHRRPSLQQPETGVWLGEAKGLDGVPWATSSVVSFPLRPSSNAAAEVSPSLPSYTTHHVRAQEFH